MRVNYVGPLVLGIKHPALAGYDLTQFTPTCYLVEVSEDAGVEGPLVEGDLLVVDEAKIVQHADLVIVERDQEFSLYSSMRIGGRMRLIPPFGPDGSFFAKPDEVRGVVVSQARRYVL